MGALVVLDMRNSTFSSPRAFEDLKNWLDQELVQTILPRAGVKIRM